MKWLNRRGVTISMSRRGNCWDNACSESFFAQMKKEWFHRLGILSRQETAYEAEQYIKTYYNPVRGHGYLGGLSPMNFEMRKPRVYFSGAYHIDSGPLPTHKPELFDPVRRSAYSLQGF